MRRGQFATALLALLVVPLGATSCATSPAPRILLIGLDGADWDILDPLIAAGRMPRVARLQESGVRGDLRTLERLPLSPVIWTTLATGRGPEAHGVTWFLVGTPDGGRVPVRSSDRRVRALWNILPEQQRRVGVVGWWATAPAEDAGDGVIASDALGFHGFGRADAGWPEAQKVHPPRLAAELAALMPPPQQIDAAFATRFFHMSAEEYYAAAWSPARSPAIEPGNPIHLFQQAACTTLGYTAIARRLLRSPPDGAAFDLFLVYYESTDSLCHLFMKDAPPRLPWVSDADFTRCRDVVDSWYAYMDEQIGLLVDAAPAGTNVVLVSDHGFRTGDQRPRSDAAVDLRNAHLDHDRDGIFLASGPLFRRGERIAGATVFDVTPTLLHALGLPVGRDMEGRVLTEAFPPPFAADHAPTWVATWEPDRREVGTAPSTAAQAPGAQEFDDASADAQLRALGYVAGSDTTEATDRAREVEPTHATAGGGGAGANSPEQHVNMGRLLVRRGEIDRAIEEFRAALDGSVADAEALAEIGQAELARGERGRAQEAFVRALQVNPRHSRSLLRLAELRVQRGELADAEAMYRQVLAIDDRLPEPWVGLGDVLERQGRHDDAASVLEHALELDPRDLVARYDLGVVRMQQGRWAEARAAYERVLELAPDHAFARNNLGTVFSRLGDRQSALDCYRRVAAAEPRHVESRVNLGSLLLDEGKPAEALAFLEEAVALAPGLEPAQFLLAKATFANGDLPVARRRFEALVRVYPGHAAGCVELARLSLREGREEEARGWLRHALKRGGAATRAALAADPDFSAIDLDALERE